mgnify:CR=1 FL=1
MECDFCHQREAVVYFEQLSGNGQKRKICMCVECAAERGISQDPRSIESSIGAIFRELTEVARRVRIDNSRLCPVCGTSLGEIRKTSRVSCPECYAIFKADIKKILENRGVKGSYTGSMPQRLSTVHSVLSDRIALQNKLDAAVATEDYEKAAMYRDYLRALENTAVSDGDEKTLAGGQT